MTQELIQSEQRKPVYTEWLASLKQRVETADTEEQEERQWRLRYGKT